MNKGIKQVRKSINQRKSIRFSKVKNNPKRILPSFPQEEEKHGYLPIFSDNSTQQTKEKSNFISAIILKGILSIILFFGTAVLLETDMDLLSKPKEWTSSVLTNEFPFARVNLWYQETFGSPMAFGPDGGGIGSSEQSFALPVMGDITESFQANGTGIMISPEVKSNVKALQNGIVIFAGNDRTTDKTVVVQHADGSETTYGFLSSLDVHLYQFVAKNQIVGEFVPNNENETVYFSIEKDHKYMDPVQVIKVDESS